MLSQDLYYMYVYEVYYSKNIFYDKDLGEIEHISEWLLTLTNRWQFIKFWLLTPIRYLHDA